MTRRVTERPLPHDTGSQRILIVEVAAAPMMLANRKSLINVWKAHRGNGAYS